MTCLTEIAEKVEVVKRSDDFGHDTHKLLLWESEMYTQFVDHDIPYLLSLLQKAEKMAEFYGNEGNYTYDEKGNLIASAWQGNKLGRKAREFLAEVRK